MAPRRVAILGSTGSIGTSTLDVIAALPDRLSAVALTTHTRVDDLLAQADRYRPRVVAITGAAPTDAHRRAFDRLSCEVLVGPDALCAIARRDDVDVNLLAVVGAAGVRCAIAGVEAGKTLALANKETLVVAGSILMPLARERGVAILPVDSEHSAIFQCLRGGERREVRRIVLTASGGPFRTCAIETMRAAKVADALKHPTWTMGAKVTIDSATMFNKALELIEAAWLFDASADQLGVVVHPQSVVHSMVEFVDGSVVAQLSPPDMRTPIQFALTYPGRVEGPARRMDWTAVARLDFEPPDLERFPSLRMGFEAIRRGGTSGAVLNAANEVAVDALRSNNIPLGAIFEIVNRTIESHVVRASPTLDELFEADAWARTHAKRLIDHS